MKFDIQHLSGVSFEGNISGKENVFVRFNEQKNEIVLFESSGINGFFKRLFDKNSMSVRTWASQASNVAKDHIDKQSLLQSLSTINAKAGQIDSAQMALVMRNMCMEGTIATPEKVDKYVALASYDELDFFRDLAQNAAKAEEYARSSLMRALTPVVRNIVIEVIKAMPIDEEGTWFDHGVKGEILKEVHSKLGEAITDSLGTEAYVFINGIYQSVIKECLPTNSQLDPEEYMPYEVQDLIRGKHKESCSVGAELEQIKNENFSLFASFSETLPARDLVRWTVRIHRDPVNSGSLDVRCLEGIRTFAAYLMDPSGDGQDVDSPFSRALEIVIERCEARISKRR
ncbi:MAG: hypothetical protein NBV65_07615 [Burkholderiaceae bacterium]|nr:hypothetical protein [Burkholderiaceae bacterium]